MKSYYDLIKLETFITATQYGILAKAENKLFWEIKECLGGIISTEYLREVLSDLTKEGFLYRKEEKVDQARRRFRYFLTDKTKKLLK